MIPYQTRNKSCRRHRASILGLVIVLLMPIAVARPSDVSGQRGSDLTAAERENLIKNLCDRIARVYPFEEISKTTREGVLRKLCAGEYDKVVSREEFAARLTADLETLSRDKHLDVDYDPALATELATRNKPGEKQTGKADDEIESARWENFGFKSIRMLEGQVGYLDLRMFFSASYAGATATSAMELLSGSRAVIVDLRLNGGGWDDMVTLLASYFVDSSRAGVVAITQSTLDSSYDASIVPSFVPGKRLTGIPIYLLTSSRTASAAEAFVSIVRHLNDSVVVVGQRTAGAENPVEMLPLDDQFVLKIPCYRKIYFGGRPGWEGTGLAPDVEVPSDRALETAHLRALHKLQAKLTEAMAQGKIQWAIESYQALLEPKTVDPNVLRSYVGRYRRANVLMEGRDLYVQFDNQARNRLRAISNNYFLIEERDDLRLRFVVEHGKVTLMEKIYADGYRSLDVKE